MNEIKKRLENVGFKVHTKHFTSNHQNLNGFSANETVLICNKPV